MNGSSNEHPNKNQDPYRNMHQIGASAGSPPSDDGIIIDCGTCVMRQTDACADCVVTFLYNEEHELPETGPLAVVLDLGEIRALRALGEAGLVPTLRHRASG